MVPPAYSASAGRWSALFTVATAALLIGCADVPANPSATSLFAPQAMRIHPIFTHVADLSGAGKPDGIEAQLEFTDPFGDPTKASGQALFELFDYLREPPFTGKRVGGPWVASLATPAEQRDKWVGTLRTYRFPLAYPAINPAQDYVLTATFELSGGHRFFSRIVLTGHHPTSDRSDGTGPGL